MKKALSILLTAALALSLALPALAAPSGFTDVPEDAPYAEAVAYVRDRGIMNGTAETTFDPSGTVTRGQLAAILYRASGSPTVENAVFFNDVTPGMYYADASAWAAANGYVNGYEDGSFRGGNPVTRQQTAAILWRMAGSPDSGAEAGFTDREIVSQYAGTAVDWAYEQGIVSLSDGETFAPGAPAERSRMAVTLMRYLQWAEENDTGTATSNNAGGALVVYFAVAENSDVDAVSSASVISAGDPRGYPKFVADVIAERTGGTLFSIRTETRDPGVYDTLADYAKNEKDTGTLPELADRIENFDDYDAFFIGYPVWWYTLPQVMLRFFGEYDFSAKTVIPFCTHYGSQSGGTFERIAELEPDATVKEGLYLHQNEVTASESRILAWLDGLGYTEAPASGSPTLTLN